MVLLGIKSKYKFAMNLKIAEMFKYGNEKFRIPIF